MGPYVATAIPPELILDRGWLNWLRGEPSLLFSHLDRLPIVPCDASAKQNKEDALRLMNDAANKVRHRPHGKTSAHEIRSLA